MGVAKRDRQREREHADKVHAPDPGAHRYRASAPPAQGDAAVLRTNALGEIERDVGSEARDEQGGEDDPGVVARGQVGHDVLPFSNGDAMRATLPAWPNTTFGSICTDLSAAPCGFGATRALRRPIPRQSARLAAGGCGIGNGNGADALRRPPRFDDLKLSSF